MCVSSRRGRSKPVNSTTWSKALVIGGLVRSRMRVPCPGGPGVSCSTETFVSCQEARFAGSVIQSKTNSGGLSTVNVCSILIT
jgi:hypothetical protein